METIQKAYGKRGDFTLLDIGCSGGEFLELALRSNIRAEGVEINPKLANLAGKRTNTKIYEGDMCKISIPRKYDVVLFTEVLEHIIELDKFLNAIHKVLNPGGMIFITTMPNTSSLRVRLSRCETPMIRDTFSHHGEHYQFVNKKQLIKEATELSYTFRRPCHRFHYISHNEFQAFRFPFP